MSEFICEHCGKEYSSRNSLYNHRLRKHGDIYKKIIEPSTCKICGCSFENEMSFINHIKKMHNIQKGSFEYIYMKEEAYNRTFNKNGINIPISITLPYLSFLNNINNCSNLYALKFVSFYHMVTTAREFKIDYDIDNFFKSVLPWKEAHKSACNSKELCSIIFPNEPENEKLLYERYMLANNPFVGHGKELSPFSKDFNGYKGLSEQEKETRVKEAMQTDRTDRSPNQIDYWTKKGLTKLQAKKMVRQRQQTFTKEKCIEKYGYEEGLKRWHERQNRWQATLKSKPYEEQLRILKAKTENSRITKPYSSIEHEFSSQLVSEDYMNVIVTPYAIPDICVDYKIIEFYGDYYHANPNKYDADYFNHDVGKTAKEIWEKDDIRIKRLINDVYEIKIVWESDYKKDKDGTIAECKKFLEEI